MMLSLPLAVASQALGEKAPEIVVHVVLGTGMLLLVRAVFDFGLPRWMNVIGALSAGAFAVIFLLQAVSRLFPEIAALEDVASVCLGIGQNDYWYSGSTLGSWVSCCWVLRGGHGSLGGP